MSRFYASVNGRAQNPRTAIGTEKTGMRAHVRGWDSGVYIEASVIDDEDCFSVYATGGSHNENTRHLIFSIIGGKVKQVKLQEG